MKILKNKKMVIFSLLVLNPFFACKIFANTILVNQAISALDDFKQGIYRYWDDYNSIQGLTLEKLASAGYIYSGDLYSPWDTKALNNLSVIDKTNYTISITAITPGSDCTELLSRMQRGACTFNFDGTFTYTMQDSV